MIEPPDAPAAPDAASESRYWAFISYSHADEKWGKWLHRALETYRVPRRLVGRPGRLGPRPRRLFPIFRDREELPSTFSLSDKIQAALRDSRYLVVICSPSSAVSRWVNEEVASFKARGREDRVLCLIVDGEPNASDTPDRGLLECFPRAVRFRVDATGEPTEERTEPIAADVRAGKDGPANARLKLLAGMLDVDLDDLRQRERRRRFWRRLQVATAALLVLATIGGVWYREHQKTAASERARNLRVAQLLITKTKDAAARDDTATAAFYGAQSIKHSLLAGDAPLDADLLSSLSVAALPKSADTDDRLTGAVAFSPDGGWLFAGSNAETSLLWDVGARRIRLRLPKNHGAVTAAAFDPGSRLLVIGTADGTIQFWNAATGAEAMPARTHGGRLTAVAFSRDGQLLAAAGDDGRIEITRVATGAVVNGFAHEDRVHCLAFSADGQRLASGSQDRTLRVWNVNGPVRGVTLARYAEPVRSVAFSPDGGLLAAGTWDTTIKLWDLVAEREIAALSGHRKSVDSIAFAGDGTLLASGSQDGTVKLWEVSSRVQIATLAGRGKPVTAVAFAPEGNAVGSASIDGTITVWRVAPRKYRATFAGHAGAVRSVAFSPDGARLASAGDDLSIKVWDLATRRPLRSLERAHTDSIRAVAFSPDGRWLASSGRDYRIILWDAATGKPAAVKERAHDDWIFAHAFAPDGRYLASAGWDGLVKLWKIPDLALLATLKESADVKGTRAPVGGVAVSPDGRWVASASNDTTVKLWDTTTGAGVTLRPGHPDLARPVAFSPDGTLLASGGGEGWIRLWDVARRQPSGDPLRGHHSLMIWALAFSPDGRLLASGSHSQDRQTLRLWDVQQRRLIGWLTGHRDFTLTVAFSPDGQHLASGGADGTIRLWAVNDFWPTRESESVVEPGALLRPFLAKPPYRLDEAERLAHTVGALTRLELEGTDAIPMATVDAGTRQP